jgi:hypothetical protein
MEKVYLEGNVCFIFCGFFGFHNVVIKDSGPLGCDVALLGKWFVKFYRIMLPSSSAVQGPVPHSRRLESSADILKLFAPIIT